MENEKEEIKKEANIEKNENIENVNTDNQIENNSTAPTELNENNNTPNNGENNNTPNDENETKIPKNEENMSNTANFFYKGLHQLIEPIVSKCEERVHSVFQTQEKLSGQLNTLSKGEKNTLFFLIL